jgi:hypothetical protein
VAGRQCIDNDGAPSAQWGPLTLLAVGTIGAISGFAIVWYLSPCSCNETIFFRRRENSAIFDYEKQRWRSGSALAANGSPLYRWRLFFIAWSELHSPMLTHLNFLPRRGGKAPCPFLLKASSASE